MVRLSRRLAAVAALVTETGTLADVGTDHGYIPVYLAGQRKIKKAIAMDINQGPLRRAQTHIRQYGLEQVIETRHSDGLSGLCPGEADSIVIAGMGGGLMCRILLDGEAAAKKARELVLQPQSEVYGFRRFLADHGYRITAEDMVLEDGKYYPMMRVCPIPEKADAPKEKEAASQRPGQKEMDSQRLEEKEAASQRPGQKEMDSQRLEEKEAASQRLGQKYGPLLLEQRHPVLYSYLRKQEEQKKVILGKIASNAREDTAERTAELEAELSDISQALRFWEE